MCQCDKAGNVTTYRRHTHRCFVSLLANLEGEIFREPAIEHTHEPDFNRHQQFRPPVKILSELVTPESSSVLPSESNLKQAIRLFSIIRQTQHTS